MQQILETISPERIQDHVRELEGIRHPIAAPDALLQAEEYIVTTFQSSGYTMLTHHFMEGKQEFRNVLATSPGRHAPEERVMVVAHYDTVAASPGADDNASGVAVLLELATICQSLSFQRSVQFVAVNLEEADPNTVFETGIARGSRALAAHARAQQWNIVGVAVLEMVAYAGEHIPQQTPEEFPLSLPPIGNFLGVVGNDASAALVNTLTKTIATYSIPLPVVPFVVPGRGNLLPATRRSDHASFWDHDIPAIMLTDTAEYRNPQYHQAGDTAATLNFTFAAQVCQALGGFVAELAGILGHE